MKVKESNAKKHEKEYVNHLTPKKHRRERQQYKDKQMKEDLRKDKM